MDTRNLFNYRFKKIAANILSIFAVLALAVPATGGAFAEDGSPYLRAFPDRNSVDGGNWPLGASVHMAIDDPSTGLGTDYQLDATVIVSPWDPNATYVVFDFPFDLKIGDVVRLTSGSLISEHTVPFLSITTVDADNDIVAGKADPGVPVHVFSGPNANVYTFADNITGDWVANFTGQLDLMPGTSGGVDMQASDGDSAIFDWSVPLPPPSPWFKVFPQWESVEALNWPSGEEVTATVTHQDLSQCGETATSSEALVAEIQLPEGCTVAAGDLVTVSGGFMTKEHTVTALEVTWFNVDENWVGGLATPGLTVELWVHGVETSNIFTLTDGEWDVDLDNVGYDLVPGTGGRATQVDGDGDRTEVDWSVPVPPNPHFNVFHEWDALELWGWPDGTDVNVVIDDPDTSGLPDIDQTYTIDADEGDPSFHAWINVGDFYNVEPGDIVTLTGQTGSRTHTVHNLAITSVDVDLDIVDGTSEGGETVYVWADDAGDKVVTIENSPSEWQADFALVYGDIIHLGSSGQAEIRDEEGNATAVKWYVPVPSNPHFTIFPDWEWFDGLDWPEGAAVTIIVGGKPECTVVAENPGNFFNGPFPAGCDVVIGDTVTFTNGETIRTHIVQNLAISDVNTTTDTVTGVADPGAQLHVWVHEYRDEAHQVDTIADDSGNWSANLGAKGLDLTEGVGGRAQILDDEGNATEMEWSVPTPPNPWLIAFPEYDAVEAWEWPDGATVYLTIDDLTTPDNPDYAQKGVMDVTTWGDPRTYVLFEFSYNLKPGDVVTVTDLEIARTHVVQNLSVTAVDEVAETVAGTADTGAVVDVWPHGADPIATVSVPAVEGAWTAKFFGLFDLAPGVGGRSRILDSEGNYTAVDWGVPNPRFTIFPEWEWMDGYDWPDGTVSVSVVGREEACSTEKTSSGGFFNGGFPDGCDVMAGDVVTFDYGTIHREHTVRNLAITYVDKMSDTVTGIADSFAVVNVWPHETGQQVQVTADQYGDWQASVAPYDIVPGSAGRSEIRDEIGNGTAVDWSVPNPRVAVYHEAEFVIGWDWPHGSGVHLTIDDPTNGEGIDFEQNAIVEPAPFDPNTWWARLDFAGVYDVKSGDIVVLTDGITTREHIVLPLTVGEIDGEVDTVAGTSFAGANVYVHPWDAGFDPIVTDESGNWMMNFTDLYDLVPGTWGVAEVFDDANNSTAIDWTVPLPVQIDILPWNGKNLVPCRATGNLLQVAVFSTSTFDATAVNHDTIRFGQTGTEAEVVTVHDRPLRYARDVNRDGLVDMVYTFRFSDTGFSCADVPTGQHSVIVQATLTGWMGNIFLEGMDNLTLTSAKQKKTGDRVLCRYDGYEYPAGVPFYIAHGWGWGNPEDFGGLGKNAPVGLPYFSLEVDGIPASLSFVETTAGPDPNFLTRSFVYNFPEGMTGTHTFTCHWVTTCGDSCKNKNELVETHLQTMIVNFTP